MDAVKNKRSLMLGIPGIILQIAGMIPLHLVDPPTLASAVSAMLLLLAGTALLVWGLALYAQSKGRSAVWCLMGFLGLIGLVVLGVLPDLTLGRKDSGPASELEQ